MFYTNFIDGNSTDQGRLFRATKQLLAKKELSFPNYQDKSKLSCSHFPDEWKEALVTPILKKPGLDPTQLNNLRPVSNLQFISKLTEYAVFDQIHSRKSRFTHYPTLQSAYRKGHSTETALLKVQNDILMNMNCNHVTLLVLLDLSAAFDTVDHDILLACLKSSVGINGTALNWFTSYLSNRSQRASLNACISDSFRQPLFHKVRVWAPCCLLFTLVNSLKSSNTIYLRHTQLYLSFSPDSATNQADVVIAMERCILDIRTWMLADKLKLNDDKTEFMLIGTKQQLSKVNIDSLAVGTLMLLLSVWQEI